MSKVDEIKKQLARRLEQQPARTPAAAAETVAQSQPDATAVRRAAPQPAAPRAARKKADAPQAEVREGVIKLSASLYPYDIECLDRIREFMRGKGVRNITDSEALRLACRAVKIDDAFMGIYEEMTKEDRRRRK
jgi:3-oxoacyl-ACP reductase-like protein